MDSRKSHPLEEIVLKALVNSGDEISVIPALCGEAPGFPTLPPSMIHAYRHVAVDVLDHLERRGLVEKDARGWYHLTRNTK
jgi:hypothetical protein